MTFVFAVLLFPLRFFVSSIYIQTIPVIFGIASALYLVAKKGEGGTTQLDRWRIPSGPAHVIRSTTAVGFAGMIFAATVTGGRTVPFFVVTILAGALIYCQIFFHERDSLRPTVVLGQIVVFAVIVRGAALVTAPGLIGVDAWVHITGYAASIQQTGQLSAIADVKYFTAPLYHLLVVVAADAFGSTLRTALYLTLGTVMPLSVLVVYFLAQYLLPVRWALFAAATFAVSDHVVRWGLHLIPTSMGLVFFTLVCYGVVKMHTDRPSLVLYAFTLFFAIATILTHQISTVMVLLFLGAGTISQAYFRFLSPERTDVADLAEPHDGGRTVNFAALFAIVSPLTALNWSFAPMPETSFLDVILGVAGASLADPAFLELPSSVSVDTDPVEPFLVTVPFHYRLFMVLGLLLLLLLTLVGLYSVLHRSRRDPMTLTWVVSVGLMLFGTLGLPVLGLYFHIPSRWFAFMYVPMVVLGAYGLRDLEFSLSGSQLLAVVLVFTLLFPGAMLTNYRATIDDPIRGEYHHQYAYSESELAAAETISTIHPDGVALGSDLPYRLLFRDWQHEETTTLNLTEDVTATNGHVVYRRSQTEGGPQVQYRGQLLRVRLPPEAVCRPSMDIVYANDQVRYCRVP